MSVESRHLVLVDTAVTILPKENLQEVPPILKAIRGVVDGKLKIMSALLDRRTTGCHTSSELHSHIIKLALAFEGEIRVFYDSEHRDRVSHGE